MSARRAPTPPPKILTEIRFGPGSLRRVVDAVGQRNVPPDLDLFTLRDDLADCLASYYEARENPERRTNDQIRRMEAIIAAAKRLKKQLTPDELWKGNQDSEQALDDTEQLIDRLERDIEELQGNLEWGPDIRETVRLGMRPMDRWKQWQARSAFEWIAGHLLPNLYEKHFLKEPSFYRRDKVPDGPSIRFVHSAIVELKITKPSGQPYSKESIAKAISDVRTNRFR